MEYDPASPTDEPDDKQDNVDIATIPLPGHFVPTLDSIKPDVMIKDIPLPPGLLIPTPLNQIPDDKNSESVINLPAIENVLISEPQFQLKMDDLGPQSINTHYPIKLINPFPLVKESTHNNEQKIESTTTFRTQSVKKRSKPTLLPVGILPPKNKYRESETKTDLFKPTKEDEAKINAEIHHDPINMMQVKLYPSLSTLSENVRARLSNVSASHLQELMNSETSTGDLAAVLRDVNVINNLSSLTTVNQINAFIDNLKTEMQMQSVAKPPIKPIISDLHGYTTTKASPINTSPLNYNIKPLPVHTYPELPNVDLFSGTLKNLAASIDLPNSLSMTDLSQGFSSLQYMNPQKMRSAQMIATPLIANEALANQSKLHLSSKRHSSSRSHTRSRSRSHSFHRRSRSSSRRSRHRSSRYRSHRRYNSHSSEDSKNLHDSRRHKASANKKSYRNHSFHKSIKHNEESPKRKKISNEEESHKHNRSNDKKRRNSESKYEDKNRFRGNSDDKNDVYLRQCSKDNHEIIKSNDKSPTKVKTSHGIKKHKDHHNANNKHVKEINSSVSKVIKLNNNPDNIHETSTSKSVEQVTSDSFETSPEKSPRLSSTVQVHSHVSKSRKKHSSKSSHSDKTALVHA